jgi:hypothetical protein
VTESETPIERSSEAASPAARNRRRAAGTRRAPAKKSSTTRKPKTVPPARPASRAGRDLDGLLRSLAKKAASARGRIASASGGGARATRRAWQKTSTASRKAIGRLAAEWKRMEPATKAQVLAALLTTLAAASAPLVRRGLKKR